MTESLPEDKQYLLLVEGNGEKEFFIRLGKELFGEPIPYYIIDYKGIRKFEDTLLPLPLDSNFWRIKRIGIVRDADFNTDAFASIKSVLETVNQENDVQLPLPEDKNLFEGDNLQVGIFIMPDNNREGMFEDLLLDTVRDDDVMRCVDAYFECLEEKDVVSKKERVPKVTFDVYMAGRQQEALRVYVQGKKVDENTNQKDWKRRYLSDIYGMTFWDWNHSAFDSIKVFLRQLVESD
ncbi:MAG: DUF3226 domain-containing protein [Chloroflexota bacterium]